MKDRILAIIKEEEMTNAKFAEEIGVQSSSISHITSGRNNPSVDFLVKILSRFPGISPEWLLLGKGKMYKADNETSVFQARQSYDNAQQSLFPETKKTIENTALNQPASNKNDELINKLSDEMPLVYERKNQKRVEKVLIFYSDKSFSEYFPE